MAKAQIRSWIAYLWPLHAHDFHRVAMKKERTHFVSIDMMGNYLDECDDSPFVMFNVYAYGIRYGAAGLSDEFYEKISKM